MESKSTDINAMAASDVLDHGSFTDDLNEFFSCVAVVEDVADVTGGHLLLQGDADGVLKVC